MVVSLSRTSSPLSPSRSAMMLTFWKMRSVSGDRSPAGISSPKHFAFLGRRHLRACPREVVLVHGEKCVGRERVAGNTAGARQRAGSGLAALDCFDLLAGRRLLGGGLRGRLLCCRDNGGGLLRCVTALLGDLVERG